MQNVSRQRFVLFPTTMLGLCAVLVTSTACPGGDGTGDAGLPNDGGSVVDAGLLDAGERSDGGATDGGQDAGLADAGTGPLEGFGTITGECDVLAGEIMSSSPSVFVNTIDFGDDGYDEGDYDLLTAGGQEIVDDGNAGGSSIESELFAYEVLARCEGAELLKTETEILYDDPMGKITDLLVEIDDFRLGVSVTRAVGFPREDPYTVEQATELLEDKLADILVSSANVSDVDNWEKQILSVLAYAPGHATSLQTALAEIDAAIVADTIVLITVSEGDDDFIY